MDLACNKRAASIGATSWCLWYTCLMRLEDAYRLLDLDPGASEEEVKRAHRDLTKVWHPDRFGHDLPLRQKAEEKLKSINDAYETIRGSRPERYESEPPGWRVRSHGREMYADSLEDIAALVDRGLLDEEAEVFDPGVGRWMGLREVAGLNTAVRQRRVYRYRKYALLCAAIAAFVLFRRPSPTGLIIALVLFVVAFVLVARMRVAGRSP